MPYDYQRALERIEDKVDEGFKAVDERLNPIEEAAIAAAAKRSVLTPIVKSVATVATSVAASLILYSIVN